MTIPTSGAPVPAVVTRIAAGRAVAPVWVNELGGVTFQLGAGTDREFVKTTSRDTAARLTGEARRLRWAGRYLRVPEVLAGGRSADCAWLHTRGLPGESAVHPRWIAEPRTAVRAIGAGLRTMHDRLPVDECPFDWSVRTRLADLPPERRADLGNPPTVDRLVVCHGDACAPNTLIDSREGRVGACCGHVDLGELGVADRWADLAVAVLSLGWNYPGGTWAGALLDAYGVDEDPPRMDYYRRLWQADQKTSDDE